MLSYCTTDFWYLSLTAIMFYTQRRASRRGRVCDKHGWDERRGGGLFGCRCCVIVEAIRECMLPAGFDLHRVDTTQ